MFFPVHISTVRCAESTFFMRRSDLIFRRNFSHFVAAEMALQWRNGVVVAILHLNSSQYILPILVPIKKRHAGFHGGS